MTRRTYLFRPDAPFTTGAEISGVVAYAPAGAGVRIGDRVAAMLTAGGGMADVR